MTELSPSARKLLEHAALNDGYVFCNSGGLTGGVAVQVRKSLLDKGLIESVAHDGRGDLFDGKALKLTTAGKLAVKAENRATQSEGETPAPKAAKEPKARAPRENTKTQALIGRLRDPNGATVQELCDAFGWQPHTTRAAISMLPKKDASLKPTSEKIEGRGRVYRLEAA